MIVTILDILGDKSDEVSFLRSIQTAVHTHILKL